MAKKQRSIYLEDEIWQQVQQMAADIYAEDVARAQRGELAIGAIHFTSTNDILRAAIAAYAPIHALNRQMRAQGMGGKVSSPKLPR